jgi:hypothetical protein
MNTNNGQINNISNVTNVTGDNNPSNLLESLRYSSPVSNHEFEIDSNNNLHITESTSKNKDGHEIVPLDLINPQPKIKTHLNKNLMLLALTSALISSGFFASAIFMGQSWTVAFAIVFWMFGISAIIASYNKRSKIYQYHLTNTNTRLFTLRESFTENTQVELFVNALNKRINNLSEKSEEMSLEETSLNDTGIAQLDIFGEKELYTQNKQSQYLVHLDFLFNHGIVDETLHQILSKKIDNKIADSENRFMTDEIDTIDTQTPINNVIKFPVNA